MSLTTIGLQREAYSRTVEPRPRMFGEGATQPQLDWCARADEWAASVARAQAAQHTPPVINPDSAQAQGHHFRKGHKLAGYYELAPDWAGTLESPIWRLVRTCCQ